DKIYFFNTDATSIDTLKLEEGMNHCYPGKTLFYVLTQTRLLVYDTLLRLTSVTAFEKMLSPGNQNAMPVYATSDTFWSLCVSTDLSGLFITFSGKSEFHSLKDNLGGYRFAGYINDTVGTWWNDKNKQIAY